MTNVLNDVETVDEIIQRIRNNKRVGVFRYGDGDFIIMYPESVGRIVGGSNRSFISRDIQKKIIEGYNIEDESYFVGTVNGYKHIRSASGNIDPQKIIQLNLTQHKRLYSAIAFQETFFDAPGLFLEFCKLINNKRTLYINHYYEDILEKFFGKIEHHIAIPQYNSTEKYEEVLHTLNNINPDSFDQIILSAGFLSRVIAKDLWYMFPKKNIFDMGSTSDVIIANEKSFNNIKQRSHIRDNMNLIKERLKYFNEEL